MKTYFLRLLQTFEYTDWAHLGQSLAPSTKYQAMVPASIMVSTLAMYIDRVFGLDAYAFGALLMVLITELVSGLGAARVRKDQISSLKLSRFSFKVFYYLVIIAVPYLFSVSFLAHDKTAASVVFDYIHVFLVMQIVQENIVSILENVAVISGKPKTHWINHLSDKIQSFLK